MGEAGSMKHSVAAALAALSEVLRRRLRGICSLAQPLTRTHTPEPRPSPSQHRPLRTLGLVRGASVAGRRDDLVALSRLAPLGDQRFVDAVSVCGVAHGVDSDAAGKSAEH